MMESETFGQKVMVGRGYLLHWFFNLFPTHCDLIVICDTVFFSDFLESCSCFQSGKPQDDVLTGH